MLSNAADMIERQMTETPFAFVNNRDSQVAVIGTRGLGVIDVKDGKLVATLPMDDIAGRRPVTLLSPDGKWFWAGDREGRVRVWEVSKLDKPPKSFEAHHGPIIGLALSANGEYLATAGEENSMRTWRVERLLTPASRGGKMVEKIIESPPGLETQAVVD